MLSASTSSPVHSRLRTCNAAQAADDAELAAEIKALETAIDYHTEESRDKRKALQERRNGLTAQKEFLGSTIQEGQANANRLNGMIETHIALAKHAETWEWKGAQSPIDNDNA
jgi:hypothetical protein